MQQGPGHAHTQLEGIPSSTFAPFMEQPSSSTLTDAESLPVFMTTRSARLRLNSLNETSFSVKFKAVALAAAASASSHVPVASFSGTSPSHSTTALEPVRAVGKLGRQAR